MLKSIIITSQSFIYSYFYGFKELKIKHIHPKKLTNKDLAEKYDLVFIDFSMNSSISNQNINLLKQNSNRLISLTPSNDTLIFRTFPFYLFDDNVTYPFSITTMREYIKSREDKFLFTRNVIEKAKDGDFKTIRDLMVLPPENEELLICYYQALIDNDELARAEEIKSNYYSLNKIPAHPRLKMISSIDSLDSIDDLSVLVEYIKKEIHYYCENIEDQLFLKSLNIDVNNEYKYTLDEVYSAVSSDFYNFEINFEKTTLAVNEVLTFDKELIESFILDRSFSEFHKMSNLSKMFTILYLINSFDINGIKSIKKRDLSFSPVVNAMLNKILQKKLLLSKSLERHTYDFDHVTTHLEFLKSYRHINHRVSRANIYNSVYTIGKARGDLYLNSMEKLGYFFKDNEIANIYKRSNRRSNQKKLVANG